MDGDELKAIRRALGISVKRFGRELGYSGKPDTISNQIRGMELDKRPIPASVAQVARDMVKKAGVTVRIRQRSERASDGGEKAKEEKFGGAGGVAGGQG